MAITKLRDGSKAFAERNQKRMSTAVAMALTASAQDVHQELVKQMRGAFDRPTNFTLKAFYIRPATRAKLQSAVAMKDRQFAKNTLSAEQMLGHQFRAGGIGREYKRLEKMFYSMGMLGSGEYLAPVPGRAQLDAFGNMVRGQITKIMNDLRVTKTDKYGARKRIKSQYRSGSMVIPAGYFWSRGTPGAGGSHLNRGVWFRTSVGNVYPVLMVRRAVRYSQRVDLKRIGDGVVQSVFRLNLMTAWQRTAL